MMPLGVLCLLALRFSSTEVRVEIAHGHFSGSQLQIPAGAAFRLVNRDDVVYTVESPGAFVGDVHLDAHGEAVVELQRDGDFVAMIEERPDSEIRLVVAFDPNRSKRTDPPFDLAKAVGEQPLDVTVPEAGYGAITQFDSTISGQDARQRLLVDLYRLQGELAGDRPPQEFALYFSLDEWKTLRTSVAMVIGLGPSFYSANRFGQKVAATKPSGLHAVPTLSGLGLPKGDTGQRDVFVRVTSDSAWFNLRVCRLIWRRLGIRIARPELDWGYTGPAGRSPILGGFYDGTGNPSGKVRRQTIFAKESTTLLAMFRIRFDEEGFLAHSIAQQEATIGRERVTGQPQKKPGESAHKLRASADNVAIVRMPLIYDDGTRGTGLLFLAVGRTFGPLETLLRKMIGGSPMSRDRLLKYMQFEKTGYYAIPPSPKGGYPGSLRKSSFTFGS